jgi:hypothetical protein
MAGLHVDRGNQPIPGHPPHDPKDSVLAGFDVLAGHQPQRVRSLGQRPVHRMTIQHAQRGSGVADQRINQRFPGFRVVPVARLFTHGAGLGSITNPPDVARHWRLGVSSDLPASVC